MLRPRHLRTRLVVPFGLLVAFLTLAGSYFLTRQVVGSLEERRLATLADGVTRAQVAAGEAEQDALDAVRGAGADAALARAVAAADTAAVAARLPGDAGLATAVAVLPDGRAVAVPGTDPALAAAAAATPQVSRSLAGAKDTRGDRHAGLTAGPPALLVVSGPVRVDGRVVGAVAAAVPLAGLVSSMRRELLLDVAVLSPSGAALESSLTGRSGLAAVSFPRRLAADAVAGERVHRDATWRGGSYSVAAGPLRVRGETAGLVAVASPEAPLHLAVAATRTRVLLVFAGGLVAVFLIGVTVSRRMSRPIDGLAAAADSVASGDFDRRVPVDSVDELGVLSRSFNTMAERLAAYRNEQEAVVRGLEEIDRAKNELVANVSHELRTPLTPLMGAARMLERPELDADARRQVAGLLESNTARLATLADRLVTATAMAAGKVPGTSVRVGVDDAFREALLRLPGADRSRVRARLPVPAPGVLADQGALTQVMAELLANACKFSDADVTFTVAPADESVALSVVDTGVGIPAEARDRIFDRFEQADGSSTRRFGGLGLGLWLARGLTEKMGGRLVLDSTPGQGTTATVELPAAQDTTAKA